MNKKIIQLILLLSLSTLSHLYAKEDYKIEETTSFIVNPYGQVNNSFTGFGLQADQNVFFHLSPKIKIGQWLSPGFGVSFIYNNQFPNDTGIKALPLYGSFKLKMPSSQFPIFLKVALGYAFLWGDQNYQKQNPNKNLKGGLFASFSGGASIPLYYFNKARLSFVPEVGYSFINGQEESSSNNKKININSLDIKAGLQLSF